MWINLALLCIALPYSLTGQRSLPPGIPELPAGVTEADVDRAARESGFPKADYPLYAAPNGCGGDDWRWYFVPGGFLGLADFTPACNRHDVCYTIGADRAECDTSFHGELVQVCTNARWAPQASCESTAETYYDFVHEDGQPYFDAGHARQKEYGEWLLDYLQILSVLLIFDTSGSMADGGKHDGNVASALSLVSGMQREMAARPRRMAVSVMTFGGDCSPAAVRTLTGFTGDLARVSQLIRTGVPRPSGGTPLTIASARASETVEAYRRSDPRYTRKVNTLLMTDGQDTCGQTRPAGVYGRASGASGDAVGIRYLTVGFDITPGSPAERDLQYLASSSGGRYLNARDPRQLLRAFERLTKIFRPRPRAAGTSSPASVRTFSEGSAAMYAQDFARARTLFQGYVEANPQDPAGWFNLAQALEATDRYRGAAAAYRRYLAAAPQAADRAAAQAMLPVLERDYADHFAYQVELIRSDLAYLESYYQRLFNQDNASLAAEFRGFVLEKGEFYANLSDALEIEAPWVDAAERDVGQSIQRLARRVDSPTFDRDAVSLLAVPIVHLEELVKALSAHRP